MFDSESGSFTGWVLAALTTAFATLGSVVGLLFKKREDENSKAITKLESNLKEVSDKADKCETDRHQLFANCKVLECKLDLLEKRIISIDSLGTKHEGSR